MDMTVGIVLLLVTGFLWVTGAILHWHNIKRQENLLTRMQHLSAPRGRSDYGEWGRRDVPREEAADDRLTTQPLQG